MAAMKTTTTNPPLSYTETEIRSYLPTGWDLIGDPEGTWDPKKKVWSARVIDGVDFDWPLEVEADDAGKLGRLEALRVAFDRLVRERLG
jgi:hypothetical protein